MGGIVHLPVYSTGFRGDDVEAALAQLAPISLRYGATRYEVFRSRDDRYKFLQTAEFETKLRALERDVLAHAEHEENEELPGLAAKLDKEKLVRMRKAVQLAESFAPTRPHAGIESAAANFLVGPFASMMDRARDALSKKG